MDEPPQSAADPRYGEPCYIDSECDCGEELVLYDKLSDEKQLQSDALSDPDLEPDNDEIWHDEWVCPECLDGVHMDWPEEHREEVFGRIEEGMQDIEEDNFLTLEEVEEAPEE